MRWESIARALFVFGLAAAGQAAPKVSFTTYFGGAREDSASRLAIDSSGNVYMIGSTISVDLSSTISAFSMTPPQIKSCFLSAGFSYDCSIATGFLAGIAAGGAKQQMLAGFVGGNAGVARAIATDSAGEVYVVGSTGGGLTATAGAYQGGTSGFLVKVDPKTGMAVLTALFDGTPSAVVIDASGNIVVAGSVAHSGFGQDAFVIRLSTSGATARSSAVFGGSGDESVTGMALLANGTVAVVGQTASTDFIASPNLSGSNAWMALVDSSGAVSGKTLLAVLAGRAPQGNLSVNSVASDSSGALYFTGGVAIKTGNNDVWAGKLAASATSLAWFRQFGGSLSEAGQDIAVDSRGRAWITGTTVSSDFPVTRDAVQAFPGGGTSMLLDRVSGGPAFDRLSDAFVTGIMADGSGLLYASYLGGNGLDTGNAVAIDPSGNVLIAGSSRSDNLRFTVGSLQPARNASGSCYTAVSVFAFLPRPVFQYYPCEDAFLAQLQPDATSPIAPQITSSANYSAVPLAPGALITIYGATQPGPATQVVFDGIAAPVIYAGGNQVNAVTPYGISARPHVQITGISSNGPVMQDAGIWQATPAAPLLFSLDGTGTGGGAILNQDLSVNKASNPAARGSILVLYLTGTGATNPPSTDGAPATPPYPAVAASVDVWFSSVGCCGTFSPQYTPGTITYSGPAPTLVAGVTQINVKIPMEATPGNNQIVVVIGGTAASQLGLTAAIQ